MRRLPIRLCALAWLALLPGEALAVSPLIVDDGDTVARGDFQLNLAWYFDHASDRQSNLVPVNPVVGLTSRGEAGLTFGYLRRHTEGPGSVTASGPFDVLLDTKWKLWRSEGGLQLSGRVDLKFPSASRSRGLGTGDTDLGGFVIATRCWGSACFDWNVGYLAAALAADTISDDSWFLGQAVRYSANESWTILAEAWGAVRYGANARPSSGRAQAGAQYGVGKSLVVAVLAGAGFGDDAPGFVATLGLTWSF